MKELSSLSGIKANTIYQIEKLGKREGSRSFRKVPRADLAALEQALRCIGRLEGGQTDDFLATFLMYYNVNYKARQGSANEQSNYVPDTKAVVFDFGGTLTKPGFAHSTWERMWLASGYTVKDAGKLLLQYRNQEINHQQWCDETCARLRERRFSQRDLRHLIEGIEPVDGLATALQSLVRRHIELFIVSGNVRDIIAGVLGETFKMFREVRANEMSFDDDGVIKKIRGHRFDFEGKAEFITGVAEDLGCSPLEVLFVGNSLNDVWAGRSGARTLLVNPAAVDHADTFVWNDCIQDMARLEEILPYSERRSK